MEGEKIYDGAVVYRTANKPNLEMRKLMEISEKERNRMQKESQLTMGIMI